MIVGCYWHAGQSRAFTRRGDTEEIVQSSNDSSDKEY